MDAIDDPTRGRRFRLREAAHSTHARLDSVISPLFDTPEGYRAYLGATSRARSALDGVFRSVGRGLSAEYGRYEIKCDLAGDLQDLAVAASPAATEHAGPVTSPTAWGLLYVVAGSSLGAVGLFRRAAVLGYSSCFGARHLARQAAAATGWRSFVGRLDALPMNEQDERECVLGVELGFGVFASAFDLSQHV